MSHIRKSLINSLRDPRECYGPSTSDFFHKLSRIILDLVMFNANTGSRYTIGGIPTLTILTDVKFWFVCVFVTVRQLLCHNRIFSSFGTNNIVAM